MGDEYVLKPNVVAYICNPSTLEVKAGVTELEASLNYIEKPCHNKNKIKNEKVLEVDSGSYLAVRMY